MSVSINKRFQFHAAPRIKAARRARIVTLGCKINALESEIVGAGLRQAGWTMADGSAPVDLCVINTCTVTGEASRQARQAIRRAVRENPDALIVVTGCYAQTEAETCAAIPGVDLVLGNDRKLELPDLLPAVRRGEGAAVRVGDLDQHVSLPVGLRDRYGTRTRAYVQVQQGCDQSCTFCIIHTARGPSRSLPLTSITRQVQRLVEIGHREIVICGVDLGAYGQDLVGDRGQIQVDLATLIRVINDTEGNFRVRLSSIDPSHLTDDLISALADSARVCPHLHLSLQSGDDLVLKRMKRRYTADQVRERIALLRDHMPQLVLSADVMTGFPTENEQQFEATARIVRDLRVAFPHVFPFSARPGTPAARIPAVRQVPVPVRRARADRLRRLGRRVLREILTDRVGTRARVLVEGGRGSAANTRRARSDDYLPVSVPDSGSMQAGDWLDVTYTGLQGDGLVARPVA